MSSTPSRPSSQTSSDNRSLNHLQENFLADGTQPKIIVRRLPSHAVWMPERIAAQLVMLADVLLFVTLMMGLMQLYPMANAQLFVIGECSLFVLMSAVGGLYRLKNNYYILGKLIPFAAMLMLAQAWLLPSDESALPAVGAIAVAFALMSVYHYYASRPYAVVRPGCFSYVIEQRVKRWVDVVVSSFALLTILPLMLGITVFNVLQCPGQSPFFLQPRYGFRRSVFHIIKFRTMLPNAEQMAKKAYESGGKTLFKDKQDVRITPFGRLLRNTSCDELPQFLNIIKGDMSLVGPRPLMLIEQDKMPEWQQKNRSRMRPGLTCLWQVDSRPYGNRDFETVAKDDARYINTWSLMGDIIIILRTVPVVLFQRGAY